MIHEHDDLLSLLHLSRLCSHGYANGSTRTRCYTPATGLARSYFQRNSTSSHLTAPTRIEAQLVQLDDDHTATGPPRPSLAYSTTSKLHLNTPFPHLVAARRVGCSRVRSDFAGSTRTFAARPFNLETTRSFAHAIGSSSSYGGSSPPRQLSLFYNPAAARRQPQPINLVASLLVGYTLPPERSWVPGNAADEWRSRAYLPRCRPEPRGFPVAAAVSARRSRRSRGSTRGSTEGYEECSQCR